MKIKNIMVTDIANIKSDATVAEALLKMRKLGVTSLIVETKNDYGIITRKDIIHRVVAMNKDIKKTKVSEVMSIPLLYVTDDQRIQDVARLMAKTNIRRFPVKSKNKLVGLISNSDIMKLAHSKL